MEVVSCCLSDTLYHFQSAYFVRRANDEPRRSRPNWCDAPATKVVSWVDLPSPTIKILVALRTKSYAKGIVAFLNIEGMQISNLS